jgi:hypothetical protein
MVLLSFSMSTRRYRSLPISLCSWLSLYLLLMLLNSSTFALSRLAFSRYLSFFSVSVTVCSLSVEISRMIAYMHFSRDFLMRSTSIFYCNTISFCWTVMSYERYCNESDTCFNPFKRFWKVSKTSCWRVLGTG